jgi:hypothetical protein
MSRRRASIADRGRSAGAPQAAGAAMSGVVPLVAGGDARRPATDPALTALLTAARTDEDGRVIERAYAFAARWHYGQLRASGDAYITHSLAVACILADLDMGPQVVCAGLLHDVLQDTPCTVAQLCGEFGEEIANLVWNVTWPYKSCYGSIADAMAAAQSTGDDRVLIIKLADRLHNMRTLRYIPPAKQQRKSREVLEGFAPLARALGMGLMERELTDLAAATLAIVGPGQGSGPVSRPARSPAMSQRLLASSLVLLPASSRERWLEEWSGELSILSTRRARARFTIEMFAGMLRLAAALRNPPRTTLPRRPASAETSEDASELKAEAI